MLAPGNRANDVSDSIPVPQSLGSDFQLTVDGQQVTNEVVSGGGFGEPKFSRDAIAEFEYVANRFDATQGRSMGALVNVITKSGTNVPAGSLSGYFRSDKFNAADFIANKVIPYSDQQVSGTYGGPIVKDKIHYFGNYEYERNPLTAVYSTPFPAFNTLLTAPRREDTGGGRVDFQFSSKTRLSVRGNGWRNYFPYNSAGGGTTTPASQITLTRKSRQAYGLLSQVLSNRALNEVKVGYAFYEWTQHSLVRNPNANTGLGFGAPQVVLRGLTIGPGSFGTQDTLQHTYSFRDDFTYSFVKGGRHDLKLGGEYLNNPDDGFLCLTCDGQLLARGGPIPSNIQSLFPNVLDFTTWNLAPLSPISQQWRQGIGNPNIVIPHHYIGGWVQDDWSITSKLRLNLGLRYDLQLNAFVNDVGVPPLLAANRPNDFKDFGPRLGFAYSVNDRTVIRGGFGKYYTQYQDPHFTKFWAQVAVPATPYDGRPNFASNPFNGPEPTYQQIIQGGLVREIIAGELVPPPPNAKIPYTWQTSIGIQQQVGTAMAYQVDYAYSGGRQQESIYNVNLTYDPVTGTNYPFEDVSRRPVRTWGDVEMNSLTGRTNYHALQTGFTKRLSHRWQASATYLLSGLWSATGKPNSLINGVLVPVPFPVAPDLGGEYGLAATDQRHRAVFNGIWQVGYGVQLSGLYFFGSGQRFATVSGCGDCRDSGGNGEDRLRADGTIVPLNNLVGKPLHRVDVRLQRRFQLTPRVAIDGIVEVFNVFNHANYGNYVTDESASNYAAPDANSAVAYQPRIMQLGFRVAF
jgi:hypothetical protein